jgi:hypothetical protein
VRRILLVTATVAALIVPGILSAQGAFASEAGSGCVFNCKTTTWGGYSIAFENPDPQNDPLGASAIWTVPAVSCTENGTAISGQVASWVGLGGAAAGNPDLEQTGTDSQCIKGTPSYWAWYEFTGCTSTSQCVNGNGNPVDLSKKSASVPTPFHLYKGDNMSADVVEQGPGYFVTQLWDHGSTTHPNNTWYTDWIWDTSSSSKNLPQTADWVVENPGAAVPLPDFTPSVLFQNCYWTQDAVQQELGAGPGVTKYQLYSNGVQQATTSAIGADNMSFSVKWLSYG